MPHDTTTHAASFPEAPQCIREKSMTARSRSRMPSRPARMQHRAQDCQRASLLSVGDNPSMQSLAVSARIIRRACGIRFRLRMRIQDAPASSASCAVPLNADPVNNRRLRCPVLQGASEQ